MNHIEKVKDKWSRGECCIGTAASLTDAAVSELIGQAGYDFVWLDCEHSALSLSDVLNHVRAARGAGAATFVRVPSNDPVVMKPYLEIHPAGIIVPRITSVEDAEQAVVSFRYPPRGTRGVGPSRGVEFGEISLPNYLANVDHQMMLIIQIEHIDAVNQIDAILDLPGVDSVVTGPADLSGSMGLGGQPGHPDVVNAIETVYKAAVKKNIPAGHSMGYDSKAIKHWLGLGLSWIAVDGDWHALYRHAKRMADELKEVARTLRSS